MDDPSGIGWLGWVIVGGVVGLAIGWERATSARMVERLTVGHSLFLAVIWAAAVASEVETLRGFAIVFLSSVGAYKLASLLAEAAAFGRLLIRR